MKYDGSRITFHKEKHYSEVLMQQGRVQVDADWNEQQAINKHRIKTEALDVIGECGAPVNNAGFKITEEGKKLTIGRGRYYVDGILCENEDDVEYDKQPDLPDPPGMLEVLGEATMGLVYLDVWQRHITALDDRLIREVALGGPDTSTRAKTIWQVKILPITQSSNGPVNCDSQFPEWDELVTPSTGTLNARTQPPGSTDNPCLLPPSAGYQRLENQLYRIEIHQGGPFGTATFKWSRDNGSVVTAIEKFDGNNITVFDIGPDDIRGFSNGQWVEYTHDILELNGLPGQLFQIDEVNAVTRVIRLKPASTPSTQPTPVDISQHPKLRRWDSAGEIKVEVPASNNGWIPIESGIEVQFSTSGNYKTADYWLIPARTVTGEIEWPPYEIPNIKPIPQPPLGIQHHYCRLALISSADGNLQILLDCRKSFLPLTELANLKDTKGCCIAVDNIEKILKPGEVPKQYIRYKVNEAKDLTVENGLDENGNKVKNGTHYARLDWMSEKFVALNGNASKLVRLVIEQGGAASEKKTLTVGEVWDIGGGWELTVQSIDATKKQVLFTLGYNGQKLDDKVVTQGEVYTYIEKSIAGETDVPMFVTYVDSIFAGATSLVQLRYTWAVSREITEAMPGVMFKVFKDLKDGDVICLLGGEHRVDNLKIEGFKNIVLRGCSRASKLIVSGKVVIKNCTDILIESLDISGNVSAENVERLLIRENIVSAEGTIAEWNAHNFAGFFYDLNDDFGREKLQVLQANLGGSQRTIDKDQLAYSTGADAKRLNIVKEAFRDDVAAAAEAGLKMTGKGQAFENGNYYIVGWQGDRYVALNGRIDKLVKLVIEQGKSSSEKRTLTVGETWDIGGGWTLSVQSIDAKATPRQVWLVLNKDGTKKDDKIVDQGKIYTYVEKSIGGESNVPLFVTYVDSIFAGATSDTVQLRYTWAVDTSIVGINRQDRFGVFDVVTLDTQGKYLELRNSGLEVTLSQDSTVDLMGNMRFVVTDREDLLRFMPIVAILQPGTFEIRGTVWNEAAIPGAIGGTSNTAEWNIYNFAGFFYDLKDNLGKESLKVLQMNLAAGQRIIDKDQLAYSTGADAKRLNVVKEAFRDDVAAAAEAGLKMTGKGQAFENGNYYIMGWQGDRYVALNGRIDKLVKLVIEQGKSSSEKRTLTVGETWDIGGGWTLSVQSIDAKATPRQVWLVLNKDGTKKDDKVVDQGKIYTYVEDNIVDESNVPLFVTYVDSVFAGATSDTVQLRYTWALDKNVMQMGIGDTFGVFKVVTLDTAGKRLELRNSDSEVTLSQDSTVDLMGNMRFVVADREDLLRFIPVIVVEQPAEIRGTIWNDAPLTGAIGASYSIFELTKCSATIASNLFFMINSGLKFNLPGELKIKENTINVTNGPAIKITDAGESGIQIQKNTIEADNGSAVVIIPSDILTSGITASEIQASITRAADILSSFSVEPGFIRINDNSFSSIGQRNVIIAHGGKIAFIENFCRSDIKSFINPIFIVGSDINFNNNQCALLLQSESGEIEHVHLSSKSASVNGNICRENLVQSGIVSIAAAETSILLGNVTTNRIEPIPDLQRLNLIVPP